MADRKEKRARIRNIKDSTENWEKANPILLNGEIGFEVRSDGSVAIKIGDGKTAWKLLKYITKTAKEADAGNQYLQDQIDNIVVASSADGGDVSAEVAQARVSIDGTNFATLKDRLDADQNALAIEIGRVETDILSVEEQLSELNSIVGITWIDGKYISANGTQLAGDNSRKCTDYIVCNENTSITYIAETNHTKVCGISFYDADFKFISGEVNVGDAGTEISTVSPVGTYYCRLSTKSPTEAKIKFEKSQLADTVGKLSSRIASNDVRIDEAEQCIPDIYKTLELLSNDSSEEYVTHSVLSASATVDEQGVITVEAGGYYFTYYNLKLMHDYALVETEYDNVAVRIYNGSSNVWGDELPSHHVGNKNVFVINKVGLDSNWTNFVVRIDNRTGDNPITSKYTVKNVSLERVNSVDLENTMLDDKIANGIYTGFDPKYQSNQSGCTFNSDGSFTISAGGHYFPIYVSPLQMKGDCIVRIKGSGIGHINIARSETGSSGVTPYITTETNGEYEQVIISKDVWDEQCPYMQIRLDNRTGTEDITIQEIIVADMFLQLSSDVKSEIAYVSTDGSDNNDGTTSKPYATVNKALESGASVVGVYGGRYKQTIDLSKSTSPNVEIRCMSDTKRVIFESPDCVLGTSESLVSGYTKVYRIETSVSIADGNKWIYLDGVADETTLISDAERHPLERGYTYRCEDTKIVRCTSTTVNEALSEIESSDIYKWYLDSDNGVLYFSRPQAITTDNPLCYSSGTNLFANLSRKLSLKLVGIETKYLVFNTMLVSSAEVLDCKAANVFNAGAFRYDRCQSAMFVRCEAVRCQTGNNGDGFNAHSLSTGDIHSKQTNVTLFDCYSHDNQDDGYSDHERSEITIIGGLYEYNGKAGVTPSYGSHCTCHNVYSRNNNNGFLYTGDATEAEGGKYGQMVCHNCVAEDNRAGGSSTKAGFIVQGTGNTMTLVGCKSINNRYGYYVGSDTASATLIDCTGLDNDTIKFGNNITIKNTAVVTE